MGLVDQQCPLFDQYSHDTMLYSHPTFTLLSRPLSFFISRICSMLCSPWIKSPSLLLVIIFARPVSLISSILLPILDLDAFYLTASLTIFLLRESSLVRRLCKSKEAKQYKYSRNSIHQPSRSQSSLRAIASRCSFHFLSLVLLSSKLF